MKTVVRIVIPLLAILVVAACTRVLGGTVRSAPGLTPRPLTGQTVTRVLPDDGELSKMLGQSFTGEPALPPRFGGPDELSPLSA